MLIVVARDRPELFQYFRSGFAALGDVRVIMDRRRGERRVRYDSRRVDRRRGERRVRLRATAELRGRGFLIVASVSGTARTSLGTGDAIAAGKPRGAAGGAPGLPPPPAAVRPEATRAEAPSGGGPDALADHLLARALVLFEREGVRQSGILERDGTRAWRCGHCRAAVVIPKPDEFLPGVGRACAVCRAEIVQAEVAPRQVRSRSMWGRALMWLGRRRG